MKEETDARFSKDTENSLDAFINQLLNDINEYAVEKQEKLGYHQPRENFTATLQDSLEDLINYFDHRVESDQAYENPHLERLVVNCAKEQHIDLTNVATLNRLIKLLVVKLPPSE